MQARPRQLLKEISQITGLNWSRAGSMIIVGDDVEAKLRTSGDNLKTSGLVRQLLAASANRARLRLS